MKVIMDTRRWIACLYACASVSVGTHPTEALAGNDVSFSTSAEVYQATLEACSAMPAFTLEPHRIEFDRYNAGVFPSRRFNRLIQSIQNEAVGEALSEFNFTRETGSAFSFVRSEPFLTALKTCYGQNHSAKERFIRLVQNRDRAGKFLGAGLQVTLLVAGARVFGLLASKSKKLAFAAGAALTALSANEIRLILKKRDESYAQCGAVPGTGQIARCMLGTASDFISPESVSRARDFNRQVMQEFIGLEIEALNEQIANTSDPQELEKLQALIDAQKKILHDLNAY